MSQDSQDIESVTTTIQPDQKTRRYDRQLRYVLEIVQRRPPHPPPRLWAASGQSALESARVLVVSGRATSTVDPQEPRPPGIGQLHHPRP
ncbi:hypothetical protein JVU11DRAFT_8381 [Chiua virens]|nr:hypothetical protein JVU11DRAFT_8381 [Chiua virens]